MIIQLESKLQEAYEIEYTRCFYDYMKVIGLCGIKRDYEIEKCKQEMQSLLGCADNEDEDCILLPEQVAECERQVDENP